MTIAGRLFTGCLMLKCCARPLLCCLLFWLGCLLAVPVLGLTLVACGGSEKKAEPTKAAETKAAQPAAAAPAAAEKPAPIALRVDTVWGSKCMTDAEKPLKSCVQTSRVKPGETIGWQIGRAHV